VTAGAGASRVHLVEFLPLGLGVLALLAGTALGWDARVLDLVAAPPAPARILLTAASIFGAFLLLGSAVRHLEGRDTVPGDLASMIRGVRLAFLALAAVAMAAGWLLAHPLPFVVALIIAGIDVIETSFLLLVVRRSPTG
jgi:hypothetical protein